MKRVEFVALLLVAVFAFLPVGSVQATGNASPLLQAPPAAPPTLKLTLVISRFQNEKKTGSLPFELMIVPGPVQDGPAQRDGDPTNLQVGTSFPYTSTTVTEGKAVTTTQWQSLGTQITASGRMVGDGGFIIGLSVTDNQISADPVAAGSQPKFQNFRSTNRLILRSGQTIQYTAAADKTSGEVIKLDVTLNVIK